MTNITYTDKTNDGDATTGVLTHTDANEIKTAVNSKLDASGGTDLAVADGGTGASDASGARNNLGAAATLVTQNAQTGTTYTLVRADADKGVTMSNASANTLTIPTNASVAFPVGTTISVIMLGAGVTTITGDTGVTVNGVSAGSGDISTQYGGVTLWKIATDTWIASGAHGDFA